MDSLDREVLEHPGTPQETLRDVLGWDLTATSAKTTRTKIRKYLKYKLNKILRTRKIGELEGTEYKADGSLTTKRMLLLSEEDSLNPKRIMELMGYDPLQWEVTNCKTRRNYWDVITKDKEGTAHKNTSHAYSCELTVKPLQDELTTAMVKAVYDEFEAPELITYPNAGMGDLMLELPIMDLHLGKLAWKGEVGENYNLRIAERLYKKVITQILQDVDRYGLQIEKIIFPIGQDFLHADTAKSTTTAGTPMDVDTRWPKMYGKAIDLAIWAVENLRSIAPVECMYVASNHDRVLSYAVTQHVAAWFRKCKDVNVNISAEPQQFVKYGKVLIGFSHGEKEGKRIETFMQAHVPKLWGSTEFREWHLGHLHSEHTKEIPGLIIRNIASITASDSWHREHGYKAFRKAQAFLWDKNEGKKLTIDVNIKV